MNGKSKIHVTALVILLAAIASSSNGQAEKNERAERVEKASASAPLPNTVPNQALPVVEEELTAQDKEMIALVTEFAKEASQVIEQWISSGAVSEDKLLSCLYYPIENTDPTKYTTDYDSLADRDFPAIQEKFLGKSATILFAIVMDRNAYVPTHNRQFSQPLSGNRALDFINNRTKRFFGDLAGFNGARSQKTYLLQPYQRDTGEIARDVSTPIMIRGKHFGAARIGYRAVDVK